MNASGDPPFRPPPERRAWPAIGWIAATLIVIAALIFAWDPPTNPQAALAMPSLPSLPDPAAAAPDAANADAGGALPQTAASGTELIEVCGVGWVPPDATGAADVAAVAGDRDVLASQRALLDALRRRDGDVGDAIATVLELQGAGRDNAGGTPYQALMMCAGAAAAPSASAVASCSGQEEDRQLATKLVDRLAKRAAATSEPRVYALAMQSCQWSSAQGSCALLNVEQWARVDEGNALPWLYILQRASNRNDAAQVEEALYRIGTAARYETSSFAIPGKVADRAGSSDVDVVAALLLSMDGAGFVAARNDPFTALTQICRGPALADANRRQACELAAQTLTERSDSILAVIMGASIGRRLGWPADRVDKLRGLQMAGAAEANSMSSGFFEVPSSCASARRILASFSRKAREGEVQTARAWVASHGGPTAFVAPPLRESTPGRTDDAARGDAAIAPAAIDAASAALAGVAAPAPVAESTAPSAPATAPPEAASAAASATPYSATPPPDR